MSRNEVAVATRLAAAIEELSGVFLGDGMTIRLRSYEADVADVEIVVLDADACAECLLPGPAIERIVVAGLAERGLRPARVTVRMPEPDH